MICLFLRLSNVRIFPSAAVQAKKATFEGALDRHNNLTLHSIL